MTLPRRARPTIRCLTEDLDVEIPGLDVDMGLMEHPWLEELRRIAPTSPTGQKRILSIAHPLIYRLRVSSERGATWVDSDDDIVWLCAVRRREEGSDDDAFEWFAELHAAGTLLPSDDDRLRDRAEEAIRLHRRLTGELFALVGRALASPGVECAADLDEWLPCRVLVLDDGSVEEIWCGLSVRATDDVFIRPELRDILFASLEAHLAPAIFEARDDWPTGEAPWFETVRLGLR